MPGHQPSFVVLGAGPAGLAAAYKLSERGWKDVTVLERGGQVGGNAGSFFIDGIPVDFGSHRLHPVCPPAVMADIRALLGDDLIERPRHGRIRLRGRWVHFPLEPFNLLTHIPPGFIAGVMVDALRKPFAPKREESSFASILEGGLGRTICRDFYFPYAEKIWGLPASELDPEQAKRRVGSSSIGKMVKRVLSAMPGVPRPPGTGKFFYPRHGYGQISLALQRAAENAGAAVHLHSLVTGVIATDGQVRGVEINVDGGTRVLPADYVLSTIPVTVLARLIRTGGATTAPTATERLRQRSMVLVYLSLDADRFTEFDAHYFPEATIRISRLSEPKNYSLTPAPGRTVLCAELPCAQDGPEWLMSDQELGALVVRDLERAGLGPIPPVKHVETRRLPHAYPLYTKGYREALDALDQWIAGIDGLITFGRQGLFAHDNTHHTMAMAYELVDCIRTDGSFDRDAWARARRSFERHVVED